MNRIPLKIVIHLVLIASLLSASATAQKSRKAAAPVEPDTSKLSADQQHALASLLNIADKLKSESDRPAASLLQAQIADIVWKIDQQEAKSLFRLAFDTARRLNLEELSNSRASLQDYTRRQTIALTEILRRFRARDKETADIWLKEIEQQKPDKDTPQMSSSFNSLELLAQLAFELVEHDPAQALQIGLRSLTGQGIPDSFGKLLFALGNQDRKLSDVLLRQAIAVLRRNEYIYSSSLLAMTNYVFAPQGTARIDATPANVRLMTDYFLESATAHAMIWRNLRASGIQMLPDSSANTYGFLLARGIPIIEKTFPDKLSSAQASLYELASGLGPAHRQQIDNLLLSGQQQAAIFNNTVSETDLQIQQAEQQKDSWTRNMMLRRIAVDLMYSDEERALSVTAKISDPDMRSQTEDDVRLSVLSRKINSSSYEDTRLIALKLNNLSLKAKALSEMARYALSKSEDTIRATEILSETYSIAMKGDDIPDKLAALLTVTEMFASFDPTQSFEVLASAVSTTNRLKVDQQSGTASSPPFRIKVITAVNGKELTTGEYTSIESIDFNQVRPLARRDYTHTRLIGENIENKMLKAKFFIAVAGALLDTSQIEIGKTR